MIRPTSNSAKARPGIKLVHRFRSNVVDMTTIGDRLIVILASGKVYRSNKKATRWYRIKL